MLYPEGTTYSGDEVRPFRAGAFLAAQRTGAEIVPVGIAYEGDAASYGETSRSPSISLTGQLDADKSASPWRSESPSGATEPTSLPSAPSPAERVPKRSSRRARAGLARASRVSRRRPTQRLPDARTASVSSDALPG